MLKAKNAGGWVLAIVALGMFMILLVRGLSRDDAPPPVGQVSADMVMTGKERLAATEFSVAFEAIAARCMPWVVMIYANSQVGMQPSPISAEDFFPIFPPKSKSNFRESESRQKVDFGCGVIVSSDGYILTNHHILASSSSSLQGDSVSVVFSKDHQFIGTIVGSDPLTDLALVKISAKGLPAAKFGDSDRLRVGQWVLAIGRSLDHSHPVTTGIISAKGRGKAALLEPEDCIQIDALIHAGNSGGALVNLNGELVGINNARFASSEQYSQSGFAIPGNLARGVMQSLMREGKVRRGFIGVVPQDIDPGLARALNLESVTGALLVEVAPEGPAEQAGLHRGDVVLQFANKPVQNAKNLQELIAFQTPGQKTSVVVWRDSLKLTLEVTPEEWKIVAADQSAEPPAQSSVGKATNKLGVHIRNLPFEAIRRHNVRGVLVSQVDPECPANQVLSAGDVIQEINRKVVSNEREFRAALRELKSGDTALLLIRRGDRTFYVGVELM
jgi:serine protease Do